MSGASYLPSGCMPNIYVLSVLHASPKCRSRPHMCSLSITECMTMAHPCGVSPPLDLA